MTIGKLSGQCDFGQKGQSYCNQRGQSCVAKRVKVAWLFQALGIVGPVDYSMSPGIIAATGCASRFPLIPAGIGLVVCAFFPGFIECLNAIPGVVMGAVLLYLMASQLSAGMQMMIREKAVDGFDGGLVVGFSLMVALLLSFAPDEALNSIPALIRPIVGNGFVMGVITVLILEHLIFRSGKKAKKE